MPRLMSDEWTKGDESHCWWLSHNGPPPTPRVPYVVLLARILIKAERQTKMRVSELGSPKADFSPSWLKNTVSL